MQNRKSLWAMAFAVFLCVLVWTVQLPVYAADTVHVITITGEIDGGQAALVQRGIKEAEEQQDQAVLIRINTQGAASTVRCVSGICCSIRKCRLSPSLHPGLGRQELLSPCHAAISSWHQVVA